MYKKDLYTKNIFINNFNSISNFNPISNFNYVKNIKIIIFIKYLNYFIYNKYNMSDILIWILLLFVFIIIIGLYNSEFTPLQLNEKQKILDINYVTENFTPNVSTTSDQSEGAHELYHWGLPEERIRHKEKHHEEECHHTCEHTCPKPCPQRCHLPEPVKQCHHASPRSKLKEVCHNCDITLNKDIDKYVLKSSVPACPDMSEYVTKSMIPATPNLSDYILKSEVKPCEKVDISQYILKSEIPACPTCPTCPECPTCPVCPEPTRCKEIHDYSIEQHPDFLKYIKKDDILNSPIVKEFVAKREAIQKAILEEESFNMAELSKNPKVKEFIKNNASKICKDINYQDSSSHYINKNDISNDPLVKDYIKNNASKICNDINYQDSSKHYINKNDISNDPLVKEYLKTYTDKQRAIFEEEIFNPNELSKNPKSKEYLKNHCSQYMNEINSSRILEDNKIRHIVEEESRKNDKPIFPMNLNVNGFYTGDSLYAGV